MSFASRLKERREALGMKQSELGKLLGITGSAIGNYENGVSSPKADILYRVFDVLKCDANYLFQDEMSQTSEDVFYPEEVNLIKKYRDLDDHGKDMVDSVLQKESDRIVQASKIVPLFETEVLMDFTTPVSAGAGIIFEKAEHNDLEVVSNIYTRKADYTLTVSGNSMLPRFKDGDRILVQETEWIEIGEIGVFWYDGRSYVKQLGHNRLISLNPDYHDIYLENYFETRCEGRVIGVLDPDWIVK